MSHRSRRSDDRDWSHSSHKYEHRHSRHDDSRDDRESYYHSSKKSSRRDKSRSRYRNSRSRSPSYGSKNYSRHHRGSRSKSPGHSSRHHRSRSRSPAYHSSRHNDDYYRSHRHKELPDSKLQHNSREHSQTKHCTVPHDVFGVNNKQQIPKYDTSNQIINERGPMSISNQINDSSQSNDYFCANNEPKTVPFDPNDPDAVLEEEKQRIQRETLERLQKHLEAEGKKYPPPKPQASHPIFANDGSFLEMFKSMQGNMQQPLQQQIQAPQLNSIEVQPKPSVPTTSTATNPINRFQPINRRRGAKILKTGIVQKQRIIEEPGEETAPSDSWNAYLKEVKRYKTVTCSDDNITRSLVK